MGVNPRNKLDILARAAEGAGVAVIEGVMGLFDGKGSPSLSASTAEMAIWLDAEVVLVLDGSAMAGSVAAIAHGGCLQSSSECQALRLPCDPIQARCRPAPIVCRVLFYYQENLELRSTLCAELIEFSPVSDHALPPDLDGIYLGGGYPELHAQALSANESMRAAIAKFAANDAPVYAECGGFMYLAQAIVDTEGRNWPVAGIFPINAWMQPRARGHEFRYSVIDPMPETIDRAYRDPAEGYRVRSVPGSYVYLHFLYCPGFGAQRGAHH